MQICSGATTIADDADGGACYMTGGGAVERWSGGAVVQHVCVVGEACGKGKRNSAIAIINQFSQ